MAIICIWMFEFGWSIKIGRIENERHTFRLHSFISHFCDSVLYFPAAYFETVVDEREREKKKELRHNTTFRQQPSTTSSFSLWRYGGFFVLYCGRFDEMWQVCAFDGPIQRDGYNRYILNYLYFSAIAENPTIAHSLFKYVVWSNVWVSEWEWARLYVFILFCLHFRNFFFLFAFL